MSALKVSLKPSLFSAKLTSIMINFQRSLFFGQFLQKNKYLFWTQKKKVFCTFFHVLAAWQQISRNDDYERELKKLHFWRRKLFLFETYWAFQSVVFWKQKKSEKMVTFWEMDDPVQTRKTQTKHANRFSSPPFCPDRGKTYAFHNLTKYRHTI